MRTTNDVSVNTPVNDQGTVGKTTKNSTVTTPADSTLADTPENKPENKQEALKDKTLNGSPNDSARLSASQLQEQCQKWMKRLPHAESMTQLPQVCAQVRQLPACHSVKNQPIFHFDRDGESNPKQVTPKILVFALVHGDEEQGGSVALSWMHRLLEIQPRNTWRVVPVLNPDGWDKKTRTNANGVDVNRNYPSRDWDELALKYWKSKAAASERRFPGKASASEPETICSIQHIDEFKPDFIITIHTPLGVLDFDGPKVSYPKFQPLPWVSLGNFPGSLGRFMWVDRNVPVLTVELKAGKIAARQLEQFDKLQDISGTIALQAEKAIRRKKDSKINGAAAIGPSANGSENLTQNN